MFKSLFELTKDVAEIAVAPIQIAADITSAAIKPIKEVVEEIVEEVKDLKN